MAQTGGPNRYRPNTPRKKVRRAKPAPAPTRAPARAPVTDVQSSGGNYGLPKAKKFKKTTTYKQSVGAAKPPRKTDVTSSGGDYGLAKAKRFKRTDQYVNAASPKHLRVAPRADDTVLGILHRGRLQTSSHSQSGSALNRKIGSIGDVIGKPTVVVGKDYANTVLGIVPSTVHLAGEVVTGHPGKAAKQLIEPYKQLIKDPVGTFKAHPFSTAIMVAGPVQGLTRGAGALGRRGTFGEKFKNATLTAREPAVLEHGLTASPRPFSPDPVVKAVQVKLDKRAVRRGKNPARITDDQLKKRVDELEGTTQNIARREGQQVAHDFKRAVSTPTGKRVRRTKMAPEGTTSIIAQNIVRPTREDVSAYLSEIKAQHEHLEPVDKARNEQTQALIQKALDTGDLEAATAAARRYQQVERPLTEKLVKYNIIDRGQAAKRRELPFAVRNLEATRETAKRLTPTGVRKFVTQQERQVAARAYQSAKQAESKAAKQHRQAMANARVSVARRKSSPALKNAERDLRRAQAQAGRLQRSHTSLARKVGKAEGRAAYTSNQADRALLRSDDEYLKRAAAARHANIEKSQAAKAVRNAQRNPGLYSAAEHARAQARYDKAVVLSRAKHQAMQNRIAQIKESAAKATSDLAGRRIPVEAEARQAQATAAQLGRRPVADLSRVERVRGREQHLQSEKAQARAYVRSAERRVAAERQRISGVAPREADALRAAIYSREAARQAALDARQRGIEARAAHVEAKKAGVGKPDKQAPGFVDPSGRPLTTKILQGERQAAGLPEPAYVSQAGNITRPGSFYRHFSAPVQAATKAFTGNATLKGTIDASHEALLANVRRLQTLASAHEGLMRWVSEFGMRDERGAVISARTREGMQKEIDKRTLDPSGKPLPDAREWVIVRKDPFGASDARVRAFMDGLEHAATETPQPILDAVTEALNGQGDGPFVAAPKVVRDRQLEHVRILGQSAPKAFNVLNSLWRRNVLTFGLKWPFGNVAEGSARTAIAGARRGDAALYRSATQRLAAEGSPAADAITGSVGHGGHFGFVEGTIRHTRADEFRDVKYLRQIARVMGTLSKTRGVKWVPRAYGAYTGWVLHHMADLESRLFKEPLAGSYIRKHILEAGADKTAEAAIQDAVNGLKETQHQAGLLRYLQRTYGQYEGWPPGVRHIINSYTPFLAWTWNAANFLFHVLPKDHPVLLALMADIQRSQDDYLKEKGLDVSQRDALPGYLAGSVFTPGGSALRVGRYTPAGLLQEPTQNIASLVLPQFSGLQLALRGLDPFGQPLRVSKGEAIAKALGSFILPGPIAQTVGKPGDLLGNLNSAVNPLSPVPADRVEYARNKATLDRLKQELQDMPPAAKAKDAHGNYTPEYRRLLDQQADLTYTRTRLLDKAGLKPKPTVEIDRKIQVLNRKIRDLPRSRKVNDLGFATKEYADLQAQRKALQDQRAKIAPRPQRQTVRQRPKTPRQQILDETRRLKQSSSPEAIRKELRDEMNRLKEQARVARGG